VPCRGGCGPETRMPAARAAVHPDAHARGGLVAVGEQVLAAAEATKWHTQSLAAFRSARGPLAVLHRGQVVLQRPAFRVNPIPARRLVSDVDLHTMAAGTDD